MLSRYCRAVSKSERMMRALRSESLNLMCAVSTAKGELYFWISSLRIVPEPKQETYSAVAPGQRAARGRRSASRTTSAAGRASSWASRPCPADGWPGGTGSCRARPCRSSSFMNRILARVDDRLHHHVFQAGLLHAARRSCWQSSTAGRHRHGAGDVLAGLQRGDATSSAWSGIGELMCTASTLGSLQQLLEVGVALARRRRRRRSRRASSGRAGRWRTVARADAAGRSG